MSKLCVLDLFSGIGGFSLGLERTGGFETVAFCEIEDFPRRVLRKNWPEVPIYDDVRTLTAERLAADGIAVDVICGGFPCQDISRAGCGAGLDGERSGLWIEYARIISEVRPSFVIVENSDRLRNAGRGFDQVLRDLAALGYNAEWHCIPASIIGAPHPRDRIWVVAYSNCLGQEKSWSQGIANDDALVQWGECAGYIQTTSLTRCRAQWSPWWLSEPALDRMVDGVSEGMDGVAALGNAIVPQIAEMLGDVILEIWVAHVGSAETSRVLG